MDWGRKQSESAAGLAERSADLPVHMGLVDTGMAWIAGWLAAAYEAVAGYVFHNLLREGHRVGLWLVVALGTGIAVYFASDASRFHTGDSVVIDGGYTIF